MAKKKDKKWIQKAIKNPGVFREWCIRRGYSGVTKACIEVGKRSKNPTTRRRAALAEILMKLRKKEKEKEKK